VHRPVDRRRVPARHVPERPQGQAGRIGDPEAAVAEVAPQLREQGGGGGVVEVHGVAAPDLELHQAEGVARAGPLAEPQGAVSDGGEQRRGRRLALPADDLVALAGQVAGVPGGGGEDLAPSDRGRDVPGGPEDHGLDRRREDRGPVAAGLADDHFGGEGDLARGVEGAQPELRHVDHHRRPLEAPRRPAPALGTRPLAAGDWLLVAACSAVTLVLGQLVKARPRRRAGRAEPSRLHFDQGRGP
jgi:hypothetical protein